MHMQQTSPRGRLLKAEFKRTNFRLALEVKSDPSDTTFQEHPKERFTHLSRWLDSVTQGTTVLSEVRTNTLENDSPPQHLSPPAAELKPGTAGAETSTAHFRCGFQFPGRGLKWLSFIQCHSAVKQDGSALFKVVVQSSSYLCHFPIHQRLSVSILYIVFLTKSLSYFNLIQL